MILTIKKIDDLGTTTFRLPYTPVTFGALAGRHIKEFFDIERKHQCIHGMKK